MSLNSVVRVLMPKPALLGGCCLKIRFKPARVRRCAHLVTESDAIRRSTAHQLMVSIASRNCNIEPKARPKGAAARVSKARAANLGCGRLSRENLQGADHP